MVNLVSAVEVFDQLEVTMTIERNKHYRDTAKRLYHDEGNIEIDDDAQVNLEPSGDAYVGAWVFVRGEDVESNKSSWADSLLAHIRG